MKTGVLRLVAAHPTTPHAFTRTIAQEVRAKAGIVLPLPTVSQTWWRARWRVEYALGNTLPYGLREVILALYQRGVIDSAFFASSDGPAYRDVFELRHRAWWQRWAAKGRGR